MGWASAGSIFDPVARAMIELKAPDEMKTRVLGDLIGALPGAAGPVSRPPMPDRPAARGRIPGWLAEVFRHVEADLARLPAWARPVLAAGSLTPHVPVGPW
jgi:hypothetical protein